MNTVRTVSDAKRDFFQAFPQPITAVYRKVLDELLVELHLLSVNQTFRYDSIFALGVATVFDKFMAGYLPENDVPLIFTALLNSVHLSPGEIRQDAHQLQEICQHSQDSVAKLLTSLESYTPLPPLSQQLRDIAGNPKFKYSRLFAIGLFTLIEAVAPAAEQMEMIKQSAIAIYPNWNYTDNAHPADRFLRDLDLYRSNLEKLQQARQMMIDLVEAERKKRANKEKQEVAAHESPAGSTDHPAG